MASTLLMFLLTLVSLVPLLTVYTLRYSLRLVGWYLRRKTQSRRELILERVKLEEDVFRRQKRTQKAEDEDWEKVEGYSAGSAPNGATAAEEWEGVVGFFHPFWYVPGPSSPRERWDTADQIWRTIAMQEVVENECFGQRYERHNNGGQKLCVSSTLATTT